MRPGCRGEGERAGLRFGGGWELERGWVVVVCV